MPVAPKLRAARSDRPGGTHRRVGRRPRPRPPPAPARPSRRRATRLRSRSPTTSTSARRRARRPPAADTVSDDQSPPAAAGHRAAGRRSGAGRPTASRGARAPHPDRPGFVPEPPRGTSEPAVRRDGSGARGCWRLPCTSSPDTPEPEYELGLDLLRNGTQVVAGPVPPVPPVSPSSSTTARPRRSPRPVGGIAFAIVGNRIAPTVAVHAPAGDSICSTLRGDEQLLLQRRAVHVRRRHRPDLRHEAPLTGRPRPPGRGRAHQCRDQPVTGLAPLARSAATAASSAAMRAPRMTRTCAAYAGGGQLGPGLRRRLRGRVELVGSDDRVEVARVTRVRGCVHPRADGRDLEVTTTQTLLGELDRPPRAGTCRSASR